jgi:hypothetical protein
MERNEKASWEKDFKEFISAKSEIVPDFLSQNVLSEIGHELNPSALKVFVKVSLIQFIAGLISLLFCPQFGLSFSSRAGIMPYLMKFGDGICMLGCGALFTSLSFLAVSFFLRAEEIRALKKHEVLQLGSIATLALGSFFCLGGEIVLALGLVWMLGAIMGGAIALEVGWMFRKHLARRAFV